MKKMKKNFNHVDFLWDEAKAKSFEDDQMLHFVPIKYSWFRLENNKLWGGNTSCRTLELDPLTNEKVEVMWIKGSGGDIGTLTRAGVAGLYTQRLRNLKNVYKGLEDEDRMVNLFNHCIFDLIVKHHL